MAQSTTVHTEAWKKKSDTGQVAIAVTVATDIYFKVSRISTITPRVMSPDLQSMNQIADRKVSTLLPPLKP